MCSADGFDKSAKLACAFVRMAAATYCTSGAQRSKLGTGEIVWLKDDATVKRCEEGPPTCLRNASNNSVMPLVGFERHVACVHAGPSG